MEEMCFLCRGTIPCEGPARPVGMAPAGHGSRPAWLGYQRELGSRGGDRVGVEGGVKPSGVRPY